MSNYQKVYMNQIHSSTLLCQLSQMLKTQTLCDAIIRTGNFITKAHRVVLVAACPMLQSMENAAAGSHLEVRLASDIKQDAVNTFLQYLYEGFMMLTEENCRDVEKVARLLQVDSVIKCCSDFYKCVQNKTGAAMPSQYKYSFQDMVEFKHVRTTDLQKMTQERLMKRTSEFSRPGSPGNKRQRIQRGESPDVSGDHADDTASMSHSYMSSTPDPWDRVPRLGSGMFSKTKSSQPGIIDIVEESLEMFQHEPLNKDGHNTDMQVPQKSAAVSISVASHKNTEPDVSIVNISSNKDTGQSSQNVSSNQRGSITVSPLTVQETSGPSSSASFSAKRQQNISSRQESRLQQQDYHSPQGPPQDSQYSNFSQVGEESMFSTSKHNQVRMSGSEMYITSTPSKQQPVPVSLTAAASVSKPFAMGSANQALAAPPVSLESQAGRNISSSSRTPAGGAGSSNQDYGGDTGPSSLKTEDSNSGDVDLSIVKVEAAQPTISQSHPSASGSSGVGPLGDETGGLDMHVDSEEGGITLTQVRAGLQDEGEELSDTELEDWAKEEMSNEGSNVSGDQNWLQQVYKDGGMNDNTEVGPSMVLGQRRHRFGNVNLEQPPSLGYMTMNNQQDWQQTRRVVPPGFHKVSDIAHQQLPRQQRPNSFFKSVKSHLIDFEDQDYHWSAIMEGISQINESIPKEFIISLDTLAHILRHATGPGNFAKRLVEKLFPELFTSENLRFQYSYHGGGPKAKKELDPTRKMILQKYVLHFYPELEGASLWNKMIVTPVNEGLRRPLEKKIDIIKRALKGMQK